MIDKIDQKTTRNNQCVVATVSQDCVEVQSIQVIEVMKMKIHMT
jgi:hypothetical protein